MAEQAFDNTNRGAIFKNDYKTTDSHPEYKGKINVDGVDKEIALWVKKTKDGKSFFSVAISEPYVKDAEKVTNVTEVTEGDDLPF